MTSITRKLFSLMALAALLNACATLPEPNPDADAEQNVLAETDDLTMAKDAALQLSEQLGPENVLVVFDIDNTLLAMEQGLGSDQWYKWQKSLEHEKPCSDLLVGDLLETQGALYYASAMRLTQPNAAQQVAELQNAGLKVIAVTSRGPDFSLQTFRELRRNNISFWTSALPPARGYSEPFIPEGGEHEALYQDGVFLTAGQDKGVMLKFLLAYPGVTQPAVIVIVDDDLHKLEAVMKAFKGTSTSVHAWRYSGEDANAIALNKSEATSQWNELRPALVTIGDVFGPDNFDLPATIAPTECQ
jgi:hypothetical protein